MNKLLVILLTASFTAAHASDVVVAVKTTQPSTITDIKESTKELGSQFADFPGAVFADVKDASVAIKDSIKPIATTIKEKTEAASNKVKEFAQKTGSTVRNVATETGETVKDAVLTTTAAVVTVAKATGKAIKTTGQNTGITDGAIELGEQFADFPSAVYADAKDATKFVSSKIANGTKKSFRSIANFFDRIADKI